MSSLRAIRPWSGLLLLLLSPAAACGQDEGADQPAVIAVYLGSQVHFDPTDTLSQGANLLSAIQFAGEPVDTFSDLSAAGLTAALEGKTLLFIPSGSEGFYTISDEAAALLSAWVDSGGRLVVAGGANSLIVLNAALGLDLNVGDDLDAGHDLTRAVLWEDTPVTLPTTTEVTLLDPEGVPAGTKYLYGGVEGAVGAGIVYLPHGDGGAIYLAWDWTNMGPNGPDDSPWTAVIVAIVLGTPWYNVALG
jgi:hypothetical protein